MPEVPQDAIQRSEESWLERSKLIKRQGSLRMKRFQKFIGVAILLEMAASCPGCQSNRWQGYRAFKPTIAQGFVPSSGGSDLNEPVVQPDRPESVVASGPSQREPSFGISGDAREFRMPSETSRPVSKNTNDSKASCSSGCCGGS